MHQDDPERYVTLVEAFRLKVSVDEFTSLVAKVMQRLSVEGVESLVSMQFYMSESEEELGAVIRFSDPDHFLEHLSMISAWKEFARFAEMIEVTEIRVYGTLNAQVEAWMAGFGGPIRKLERFIAGFVRRP